MKFSKGLIAALAIPALTVSVTAQTPAKPAPKDTPKTQTAVKPAASKPAPKQKTMEEALAFLPDVVAQIGPRKITKKEFIAEIKKQIPESAISQLPENQFKPIIKSMVNGLVDREIIFAKIGKEGFKPSAQLVKDEFDTMLKQLPKDKLAMMEAQLKMQNKTVESYKETIAADKAAQQAAAFSKWIKAKIEPTANVTDAEVKDFYGKNMDQFKIPEQVEASHILIKVDDFKDAAKDKAAKEKAEKILAQIKQGGDFGKLAAENSDCPSKSKKGSLGKFGKGMMVPEFEKAAFGLKVGGLSGVVKTPFGYHIIKVAGKTAAGIEKFDKVAPNIKNYLKSKKVEDSIRELIAKERKDQNVKVNL